MRYTLLPLATLVTFTACGPDETISGYLDAGATYRLTRLNGDLFAATATLTFPAEGDVIGQAPCNTFQTTQTAPYPWFALGPIAITRMACPTLAAETLFLEALRNVSIAEISGPVLILSHTDGTELVFQAE